MVQIDLFGQFDQNETELTHSTTPLQADAVLDCESGGPPR